MIDQIITDYVAPIVMIIGLIEFTRKAIDKKQLSLYMVLQLVFCLLAGVLIVLSTWADRYGSTLVIRIAYKWLMLVSTTTLFYQLIVKKIRDSGGVVKDRG